MRRARAQSGRGGVSGVAETFGVRLFHGRRHEPAAPRRHGGGDGGYRAADVRGEEKGERRGLAGPPRRGRRLAGVLRRR